MSNKVSNNSNDIIKSLVLWRSPFKTSYYFIKESIHLLTKLIQWIFNHKYIYLLILLSSVIITLFILYEDQHPYLRLIKGQIIWCCYWIGLGVLSSVGLGTGLHTFLLYLGPHIAAVTLAAYECDSLDFPSPPYPNEIVCPENGSAKLITIWNIMSKVRLEAFMWGAGTALGELPPYFVGRAHRLAGEQEEELDGVIPNGDVQQTNDSLSARCKSFLINLVTRSGFFGILVCASIPNPLFDLAGITCGYSLIPFITFFGATLVGKAIIKMHIQKMFVIVAFNENYIEYFVDNIKKIPYFGIKLHQPFREFLEKQKQSLHRSSTVAIKEPSWIAWGFEKLVMMMIIYFIISIINSMAQNHYKRMKTTQKGKKD